MLRLVLASLILIALPPAAARAGDPALRPSSELIISCPNLRGDFYGRAVPNALWDQCFKYGEGLMSCDAVFICLRDSFNEEVFARIARSLDDPRGYCADAAHQIHWPSDVCMRDELALADTVYSNLYLFSDELVARCLEAAQGQFQHYRAMMECLASKRAK